MFQWQGQMLYFIFLCNEKKDSCSYRVLQMSLSLPADENTGLMRKKQIFNEELEATSTIPLAHYTTITFFLIEASIMGWVGVCTCACVLDSTDVSN